MHVHAATNPAPAHLSKNAKIALGVGGAAALALLYAIGYSSAKPAAAAGPAPGGGASPGAGGGVGPPPGNKSGAQTTWTPTTALVKGQTYRVSGDAVDALSSLGFTVYTDHDAIPSDWPTTTPEVFTALAILVTPPASVPRSCMVDPFQLKACDWNGGP